MHIAMTIKCPQWVCCLQEMEEMKETYGDDEDFAKMFAGEHVVLFALSRLSSVLAS